MPLAGPTAKQTSGAFLMPKNDATTTRDSPVVALCNAAYYHSLAMLSRRARVFNPIDTQSFLW